MRTYFDCLPCILKQSVNALSICESDPEIKEAALLAIVEELRNIDFSTNPAKNTDFLYEIITEHTGIKDPFYRHKRESNSQAMKAFPRLKEIVNGSEDRIFCAGKVAIAGNAIDLGVNFDLGSGLQPENISEEIENLEFGRNDYNSFKDKLDSSNKILYMADNAGEIAFDRVFVEELVSYGKEVVFAVKSGPVINDALMEDAMEVGIGSDGKTRIIETGYGKIGIEPSCFSEDFAEIFKSADMIICKGQAHFESFDNYPAPIFFFLKCKCPVIANELKTEVAKIALYKSRKYKDNVL